MYYSSFIFLISDGVYTERKHTEISLIPEYKINAFNLIWLSLTSKLQNNLVSDNKMICGTFKIFVEFVEKYEGVDRSSSELPYYYFGINSGRKRQFIIRNTVGQQLKLHLLITIEYFNGVFDLVIRLSLSP